MLNKKQIEKIKKMFPKGEEIKLVDTDEFQDVPYGEHGIVDYVDDEGIIHTIWDNELKLDLKVNEKMEFVKVPISHSLSELIQIEKELSESNDKPLDLYTRNITTGQTGIASFCKDGKHIQVFQGNPDGSDDVVLSYEEFVDNYDYIISYEMYSPFDNKKI